jgi:hypothetical protein
MYQMKMELAFTIYFTFFQTLGLTTPEGDAYNKAKSVIDQSYQTHVLSIYGKGAPDDVQTWYFTFYDPNSSNKAKTVVIQNNKIDRVHPSESRTIYDDAMSFDPSKNKVNSSRALETAKEYAQKNQISYDSVNILYRRSESGKAPAWRVELLNQGSSRGYVYSDSENGTFAKYDPPRTTENTDSGFARDVERTFRGIGADLEEFFTGERTVDRD